MEWSGCISMLQGYLENSPMIVLGSGSSMPYGLPSMDALAKEIQQSRIIGSDPEYEALCTNINQFGLEIGIDSVALLECVSKSINPSEKRRNMQIWRKTKRETGSRCRISLMR